MHIPIIRFGEEYESLDKSEVKHFATGETIATVSQANGAMVGRDMKKAPKARAALRKLPVDKLIDITKKAGRLYAESELPCGDGTQTPEQFVQMQSASTGLPEVMCRANMQKNQFVLSNIDQILESLTRGLDLDILGRGYGEERGVPVSWQANAPVCGWVLPSNSPGVHTLWLPVIPMQIGLVLKPGSTEVWTPYRVMEAFYAAGLPREAFAVYPGAGKDVGAAIIDHCQRAQIFGDMSTVQRYAGNANVQVHGPGFSKILFGDDEVDDWEQHLDMMVESVLKNGGRSCINASSVFAPRHTEAIADALAQRLAKVQPKGYRDPDAELAAFTTPGFAEAINGMLEDDLRADSVIDFTAKYRDGSRLIPQESCDFLLPTVVHCTDPDEPIATKEFMFPFVSVVECPQDKMLRKIGYTLVGTVLTADEEWKTQLLDATNIDRINFGPVPTTTLNWLQPHEGNIVEFLFRARAYQTAGA